MATSEEGAASPHGKFASLAVRRGAADGGRDVGVDVRDRAEVERAVGVSGGCPRHSSWKERARVFRRLVSLYVWCREPRGMSVD